jgi:hypothetical protein
MNVSEANRYAPFPPQDTSTPIHIINSNHSKRSNSELANHGTLLHPSPSSKKHCSTAVWIHHQHLMVMNALQQQQQQHQQQVIAGRKRPQPGPGPSPVSDDKHCISNNKKKSKTESTSTKTMDNEGCTTSLHSADDVWNFIGIG